jgi:aldehyde dehydrogenase (NAD+)
MASEDEETTVAAVPHIVKDLQRTVRSGITRTVEWRMQQLRAILKLVQENEERITQVLAQDIGKPSHEVFLTEIFVATASCKLAIKELKKWMAPQKVPITIIAFPGTAEVIPEPFGVALIISPWNFPFLLAIDPIIGALAAGCAVVLKPSEITPTVSSLLAELIPQYLDTDAIRVVEGGVPVVTALLEQKWDKIFYTGSPRVGRIVMAAAAKHLTPVTLELGGKCPVYIDDSVDLKVSAMRICLGKWGVNVGQTCISPDYLLVEEDIVSKLVETIKATIVQFFGEDPSTSADLGRIVNEFHFQRLKGLLDDPRTAERIVYGGQCDKKSLSIAPTLVLDVPLDTPIMSDEIFGPILPIITVKGVEKAMDVILEFPKPLALYIFTTRKAVEEQLLTISAGGVGINETISHFGVPGLPFGGVGESGMGAYHGKHSFDAFSHKKGVLHKGMGGDLPAKFPPYTDAKKSLIRCIVTGDFFGALLVFLRIRK